MKTRGTPETKLWATGHDYLEGTIKNQNASIGFSYK